MTAISETPPIPQPRVYPFLGNILEMDTQNFVQSMMKFAEKHGPLFRFTAPFGSALVLSGHRFVQDVCDESRFDKQISPVLQHIREFAGDGLFTAHTHEPNWGKAHRLLMPAFGPMAMRNYFDDMLDIADQMFTKWERLGEQTALDVPDQMTRLTLDTIALSGFNYRFNLFYQREMHPFVDAMGRALTEVGSRITRLGIQTRLMLRTRRQYQSDINLMHQLTDEVIARRRALAPEKAPRDLLGLMLNAQDPVTGEQLDDENIRYQLVTFLIAGHETTSGLLSFAIYLLLKHPEIREQARALVDDVLSDRMPCFEDLSKLGYLEQILRETLRLYPTAPMVSMYSKEDTLLAGTYPVKAGDIVFVLIPSLHRDPEVWNEPERFDPERFSPERRAAIPEYAWLPFGSGQRSCLGRAFALQEATLVLAMLLQRFEFRETAPYNLSIKETLTLKPEHLSIYARARKTINRATPTSAVLEPHVQTDIQAHATPLLVLYGSNSGSSEAFARRIASDGTARGYHSEVAPLDQYVDRLPTQGAVTIVTASYNGEPPENARRFVEWVRDLAPGSLKGVQYTVFGCGHRDWASTYQAVPILLDQALEHAGAERVLQRGEADARADFFGDFEQWYIPLWPTLDAHFNLQTEPRSVEPLYHIEIVDSARTALLQAHTLQFATLLENRELVDMSADFARSKRHLQFQLPEGMRYQAGDYLSLLPENHPDLVARVLRRFRLQPDTMVQVRSTRGAMATSLPLEQPIAVEELLRRYVELANPATRKDLQFLAEHNPCPPHRIELEQLANDPELHRREILEKRVSIIELLERYDSCMLEFGELLELLPAMRVRQYSISSSPLVEPTQASLTVAVVEGPAWSGQGFYYGTASSFLARQVPGTLIPVAIRSPHAPFHPPTEHTTPLILIAAGTGLAPFRGFIQERITRAVQGEPIGEMALFFGCDHPEVDFLYRDELETWAAHYPLKVYPAYFRQPDGEICFVQHRLWAERAQVLTLIERGATIFVCGDGTRMAPAVRNTLLEIYRSATNCDTEAAETWLRNLEQRDHYVADVFGS